MKSVPAILVSLFIFLCISCTEYTPKPRGYFRIEPPKARYQALPLDSLPYTFNVSQLVTVELPPGGKSRRMDQPVLSLVGCEGVLQLPACNPEHITDSSGRIPFAGFPAGPNRPMR